MEKYREALDKSLKDLLDRIMAKSSQEPKNRQKVAEEIIKELDEAKKINEAQGAQLEEAKRLALQIYNMESQQGRADVYGDGAERDDEGK